MTLDPATATYRQGVALTLRLLRRSREALAVLRRGIARDPCRAELHSSLANVYFLGGYIDVADVRNRRSLAIAGQHLDLWKNFLACQFYRDATTPESLWAEHGRFERAVGRSLYAQEPTWTNLRDPDRRLRIGYLCSDFSIHALGLSLRAVLANHDRRKVAVYGYSLTVRRDGLTQSLESAVDGWRVVLGLNDSEIADRVREDAIDILLICGGHYDGNRLAVSAARAAPIHVSFIDTATSGLASIDYLFTDRHVVPGTAQERFFERPIRLGLFNCYPMPEDMPTAAAPPCASGRASIFGTCNNPCKITDTTVLAWSELLRRTPRSTLRLKYNRAYEDPFVRVRIADLFAQHGIADDRIDFVTGDLARGPHLDFYNRIDMALDTYPYSGATTTFEALWMGVPVVTRCGPLMVSRASAAILRHVGRPDWIAHSTDAWIDTMTGLALDKRRLRDERIGLRASVLRSPLVDGRRVARHLERACRAVWRRWCAGGARPEGGFRTAT
jgi:predicted O-linked N-acetylglucosamine transferase (SPINDLY family)